MTKRRAAWIGVAAVAVMGLVGGLLLLAIPADTVTPENCERIGIGMTLTEVEAIFGRPADQTASEPFVDNYGLYRGPFTRHWWFGGVGVAYYTFDADGSLVYGGLSTARPGSLYRRAAKQVGLRPAPVPAMKVEASKKARSPQ